MMKKKFRCIIGFHKYKTINSGGLFSMSQVEHVKCELCNHEAVLKPF